ncbi:sugar ABC transporter permease [Chitiniphilus shinanonensis]|uniref:Sugar ABC transporter permease n=1 Tax=Chitiniphilus shinanonensis TaxID=553088 RepID=A0ABQ6BXY7_9NEIS|nr:sugar ABC transporter permease [Chitiniphilus shinanonensis]GLS05381.1 sugar ABC transporter permease [Chitiniphilus shinanonensis]
MTAARQRAPYLFLAPFLLLFVVFGAFPPLFAAALSLFAWDPASGYASARFVGLDNYVFALTDPWFWQSFGNTLWLALAAGVPQHLVALPLAFWLHRRAGRVRHWLLGAYFLPFVTASVAVSLTFATLFATDYGLVNQALQRLTGLPLAPDWLHDPALLKPLVALVVFWRYVGWNTLLYVTALQGVSPALFEAAALDGAGSWRQFRHVALPLLRPTILFAGTLSLIGGLQLFEEPFILTQDGRGGSGGAAATTAIYLYRTAFDFGDFGSAAAMAWLLCVAIALLGWAAHRAFRREEAP